MRPKLLVIALLSIAMPSVASAETSPFAQGTETEKVLSDFTQTFFTGVMENGENIIVSLARTGDSIAGDIFFEEQNIRMGLRGTCDNSGTFEMTGGTWHLTSDRLPEMDDPPTFEGTIAAAASAMEGVMHHGAAAIPLTRSRARFSAEQVAIGVTQEVTRRYGFHEQSFSLNYPALIHRPAYRDFLRAANRAIGELVNDEAATFWPELYSLPLGISVTDNLYFEEPPCKRAWEVTHYGFTALTDSLVSLVFLFYYFECGVNWNSHFNAITFVAHEDGACALGIEELFRPDADFWPIIEKSCIEDLESQGAASPSHPFLYIKRKDLVWTISRGGLSFWFPKGLASGRSDGAFEARVPFSALSDILKPGMPGVLFGGE